VMEHNPRRPSPCPRLWMLLLVCTTLPAVAIVSPARVFCASFDCASAHMPLPAAALALRTTVPTLALAHQPTLAVQRHAPHRSTIDWSSPAVIYSSTDRPMAWLLLLRRTVSSGARWIQSVALPLRSCLTRTSDGVIRRAKSCVCTCTVQAWGYACTCTCHLHATRRRRRAASSPAILSLASTVGDEMFVVKSSAAKSSAANSSGAKSSGVKSSRVKSSQVTVGRALQHAPGGQDLWEDCIDVAPADNEAQAHATFRTFQQGTPRQERGRRQQRRRDGWEALDDGLF